MVLSSDRGHAFIRFSDRIGSVMRLNWRQAQSRSSHTTTATNRIRALSEKCIVESLCQAVKLGRRSSSILLFLIFYRSLHLIYHKRRNTLFLSHSISRKNNILSRYECFVSLQVLWLTFWSLYSKLNVYCYLGKINK